MGQIIHKIPERGFGKMIIPRTPFRISFAGGGSDLANYYEKYGDITEAIVREKELQELSKADLVSLIQSDNEYWQDLHDAILEIWNDSAKLHEENQIKRHKGENI